MSPYWRPCTQFTPICQSKGLECKNWWGIWDLHSATWLLEWLLALYGCFLVSKSTNVFELNEIYRPLEICIIYEIYIPIEISTQPFLTSILFAISQRGERQLFMRSHLLFSITVTFSTLFPTSLLICSVNATQKAKALLKDNASFSPFQVSINIIMKM